ncbi:MAG: hypothetical protein MI976_19505 [Pseudomonadales bacterium]|nr:hypothetical protein [Pseudomonadales bacterium]
MKLRMPKQLIGFVLLAWFSIAKGSNAQLDLSAGIDGFVDDNYGLSTGAKREVEGTSQYTKASLAYESETTGADLGFNWVDVYLSEDDEKENDYYDLFSSYRYNLQTSQIKASLKMRKDTTLADEVLISGPVSSQADRSQYFVDLGFNHQFNEYVSLLMSVSIQELQFDTEDIDLLEFKYGAVSIQPNYSYAEKAAIYGNLFTNRVSYQAITQEDMFNAGRLSFYAPEENHTTGASVGWRNQLTPTAFVDVSLGYRESKYENQFQILGLQPIAVETDSDGLIINARFIWEGERTTHEVAVSQENITNSIGDSVEESQLLFDTRYNHNEVVFSKIRLSWQEQRNETDVRQQDLTSYKLSADLYWQIFPNLQLQAGVRHLIREIQEQLQEDAESTRMSIGFKWNMNPVIW